MFRESNIKAPNGGLFNRSGLNFNAASQILTNFKARSNDRAFLLPETYKGACDMHKLFSWRVAMPAYA